VELTWAKEEKFERLPVGDFYWDNGSIKQGSASMWS